MTSPLLRAIAGILACLLSCAPPPLRAQTSPAGPAAMVRMDPKRAQRALERGIRAESDRRMDEAPIRLRSDAALEGSLRALRESDGRMDEALTAYDEAARYAPQDLS